MLFSRFITLRLALIVCIFLYTIGMAEETDGKSQPALEIPQFKILQYGRYADGPSHSPEERNKRFIENIRFIETTEIIPLKKPGKFGIIFSATTTNSTESLTVTIVINHPPMIDPVTGDTLRQNRHLGNVVSGQPNFHAWNFAKAPAMVPGSYIFRVYYKGEEVLQKGFLVQAVSETDKN
jgi:hypothetical protein